MAISPDSIKTRLTVSGMSFLAGGIAALVVQIVAVRLLGADLYGQYATAIAAVTLVELTVLNRGGEMALASLGSAWTSQRWGDIRSLTRALVRHDLRWALGGFCVLVLVAFGFGGFLTWQPAWLVIAGAAIAIQIGFSADKALLIVSGEIATQAKAEIRTNLFSAALAVAMVLTFGAVGLVSAYAFSALIKVVIFRRLANAKRRVLPHAGPGSRSDPSMGLSVQLTTTVRNVVMVVGEQADVLLVNALAGPAAAGTYKVAKSLATLPARLIGPVWVSLRPELVSYWFAADRSRLRSVMYRPAVVLSVIGVIAIPVCWGLGGPVISRVYEIDGSAIIPAMTLLLTGSWVYSGLAGWYKFMLLLDTNKWRSLRWSAGQAAWVLVAGSLAAVHGPASMAVVVATGQVATSALAVTWLMRSTRRPLPPA